MKEKKANNLLSSIKIADDAITRFCRFKTEKTDGAIGISFEDIDSIAEILNKKGYNVVTKDLYEDSKYSSVVLHCEELVLFSSKKKWKDEKLRKFGLLPAK